MIRINFIYHVQGKQFELFRGDMKQGNYRGWFWLVSWSSYYFTLVRISRTNHRLFL